MTLNDVNLLGKKILLGIVISIIPLIITVGGLTLIRKLFTDRDTQTQVSNTNHQNQEK
ncbi:hypothetical protein [Mucilaginibacter paludis]|uniref:Uncharacterized protein n=1 Tax=Mucilaginibacter paludis DSM 18603 TaxID=714943 RepID=H1YA00_9SPHI|nr:hypothetical protein [Mucilaginibacter paludis]EHQ24984.1 hypothetical protein Mucpa_0803 [Mucilaginibacter paludis DSM 18603]